MTKNAKIGFQLIQNARKNGDQASVGTLFKYYEEAVKSAALIHFKQFPFDREVSWLPNGDKRKQRVVVNAAYEAFVDAYLDYDPSAMASFETWLSWKIWSCFGNLYKASSKLYQREQLYGEESEISESGCDTFRNKKPYRHPNSDSNNNGYGANNSRNASKVNMVKKVLESMPKDSAVRKNAEMLYRILSEEGDNKLSSTANRLGISRQAVSRSFKSYREYGPKSIRNEVLAMLRE